MAGRGTDYSIKMGADISDLESKLSKARQSIENFGSNAQVAAKGMDSLFKAEGLDSLISEFDSIGNAVKKMGNVMSNSSSGINQQLRAVQNTATQVLTEFRNLSEAEQQTAGGQALYAYYQQLVAKGSELRDNIGDVKGAINAMADDARVFTALGQGVQVMASSFQVAAGAASVFGVSQEKIAAVQQKLTSIIAITNGLQQIQNLLQKESALMQTINIARTQGLAVALGLKTAAVQADTVATEANTVAVNVNSTAMKKNPIGLIVTLVAAAAVAIYELTEAFNDNTNAIDANSQAQAGLAQQIDKQSSTMASNIILINNMKNEMLAAGNNAEAQRKVFEKYRKKQVEVGIATKNAGQMHLAVVKNTNVIIQACELRMKAAAAEAAMQAELGKVIAKVAELREKAAKGETFDWHEFTDLGINARKLIEQGLLKPTWKAAIFNADSYEVPQDKINEMFESAYQQAVDFAMNGVVNSLKKEAQDAYNQLSKLQFDHPEIKWDEGADAGTDATDRNTNSTNRNTTAKNKNRTASQQSAASANDEKTAIEKLDEQYNKLIKTIGSVNKETEAGQKQFEQLKAQIQSTLMKKISIMPTNTVGDVENLIKTVQTLLEWLDKGSDEFKKFSDMLQNLRIMQANQKLSLIDTNTLEGAQAAQQIISNIVKILPSGSKELETWSKKLKDATEHARNLQNEVNGIQEGSITELKQRVSEIDRQLQNVNLAQVDRQNLKMERENLQVMIEDLEKLGVLAEVIVKPKIDITFDYKKTELEKIERAYEAQLQYINDLYEAKKKLPSTNTSYDKQIEKATAEGQRLKALLRQKTILEDLKEAQKEVRDEWISLGSSTIGSIDTIYGAWKGFGDKLNDEEANPFETIMSGFKAVEQTVNSVLGFIETIKTLNSALDSLKAVKAASEGLSLMGGADQTAQITSQAAATTALATAEGAATTAGQLLAVSQTEVMATTLATVAGVKALSNAYLELAASEYLAAHASIPFVGYAVGAGFAVAAKALVMTMAAFANGGIVGGNRLFGDMQYVRINSGEMVLSGSQQKKLFNLLDGGYSTLKGSNGSEVTFKVKGRDLIAVMNNQQDKMGKIR